MAVHNSYRASTRSHGPCYMDPRLQRGLRHPTSTPRTQPSRGQGSKPSGSKNQALPLSLPRAFRELGLRSPPAGRTRPALPPLGLRSPPAGRTHPAPPARPAGSGRRHRDAGSACVSPPANAPCTAAPPCGLRPPPPARAQGGAGAGHCRRDVRRLRARPPPPSRQPSFSGFSEVFLGIFVLHVGGQIPRDLFEEIVARTFVGSFGLILSQICHGFGLDLEFSPKPSSS